MIFYVKTVTAASFTRNNQLLALAPVPAVGKAEHPGLRRTDCTPVRGLVKSKLLRRLV